MVNLQEAIKKMTLVGRSNIRTTHNHNSIGSLYTIEINQGGVWTPLIGGLSKAIADSMIDRAANRTICG